MRFIARVSHAGSQTDSNWDAYRYKYLQKPFEETALRGILQYTNKFSPVDQEKLAVATSQFVSTGLASANVLVSLKKDHLVKDGALPGASSRQSQQLG